MAKAKSMASEKIAFLRSDLAAPRFASKGHLGEASKAIEPIIEAFENKSADYLPKRIAKTYKAQLETELLRLNESGLKRVIRITEPKLCSKQDKGNFGFVRWIDSSREWRECEITAAVLEQYIDVITGECIIENFDENALLTLRQSRHIRASEQKKNKNNDVYVREHYNCPSCGAELEHIADQTNCPFCGAYITFNFYDWQTDSFYLDMHKQSLLNSVKGAAVGAASAAVVGTAKGAAAMAGVLADALDKQDEKARVRTGGSTLENNNYIGSILAVLIIIAFLVFAVFMSLPPFVRIAIGVLIAGLIVWAIVKYLKATDQKRKKKKIVRYSDGYLRSCVYNEIWSGVNRDNLIDFSIDEINIKSVNNTEKTTAIDITAQVIKKYISDERKMEVTAQSVSMTLSRARYPERIKARGEAMAEKACPSCGANFEPDKHNCCSYCGYGLKLENFVWRRAN